MTTKRTAETKKFRKTTKKALPLLLKPEAIKKKDFLNSGFFKCSFYFKVQFHMT